MGGYEPETLSRLHEVELDIMREIIRICDENGIEYFLICGTLIGAVRHQGFIPWDDDVDIGMARPDFDRFMALLPDKLGDEYMYIDCNSSDVFPFIAPRIMKKGTKFYENIFRDVKMDKPLGVFVDIWPYDNIPDNRFLRRRQAVKASFFVKLLMLKYIRHPTLQFGGAAASLAHAACGAVHGLMKVLPVSRKFLVGRCQKIITRYDGQKTRMTSTLIDTDPLAGRLAWEDLYPLGQVRFEGMTMTTVNNYDLYLKNGYGDYMQLPPPEKRKMHSPYLLELSAEGTAELERKVAE